MRYSQHTVSSSAEGVRAFRVGVTPAGSATTTQSNPIAVAWRPIIVEAAYSPASPATSTPDNVVTLTAMADAPSGVKYQWQRWSGGKWTNMGAATTSATTTVTETARGTRKFRVKVSHGTVPFATSTAVYVTWGEWEILADMMSELSDAVTTSDKYLKALENLLACMNRRGTSVFKSFDQILASYSGTTKTLMESGGACKTVADTMFSVNQSVTRAELAKLKAKAEYAALLESDRWRGFDTYIADADDLKAMAILAGTEFSTDPGRLEKPYYAATNNSQSSDEIEGASVTPPDPDIDPVMKPGLGCLPAGADGRHLSLKNQLLVLNCLIFSTPHEFWEKGGGVRLADSLETDSRYNSWLGFDNWKCTIMIESLEPFAQGPVPSCLKHDVAYGTLWRLVGEAKIHELDEAWNPRNKALADNQFKTDILKYGCQDESNAARQTICKLWPKRLLAEVFFWGVTDYLNIDLGWPVTTLDIDHAKSFSRFITCDSGVPSVIPNPLTRNGRTVTVTWVYESGCVKRITVDSYRLCWHLTVPSAIGYHVLYSPPCRRVDGGSVSASFMIPPLIQEWSEVILSTIAIKPNNITQSWLAHGTPIARHLLDKVRVFVPETTELADTLNELSDNLVPAEYYPQPQEWVYLSLER